MQGGRVLCPVLVGRDDERDAVASALDAARDGRGSLLIVVGEAGVGKSRLVRDAAVIAERGKLPVLAGRAVRRDTPAPFRPVAEAVLPVLEDVLHRRIDLGAFRRPLLSLAPELTEEDPGDPSALAVGEAVVRVLRARAASRACLLVLEDLHWADPETLTLVDHLADRLRTEPAVCLVSVRSGEPSPAIELVTTLAERRSAEIVTLDALGAEDVDRMIAACLRSDDVPDDVRAFVRRYAEGVPFLVEEMLAGLVGAGSVRRADDGWHVSGPLETSVPRTFAETVTHRLDALEPDARTVVTAAAVLGRRFDWTLLPSMTGIDEATVLDALRRATAVQLVDTDDVDGFTFRHALSAEVVAAQLLPPERAAVAVRAIDALEAADPDLAGDRLDLALELAEAARAPVRAARFALEAGRRALARGALVTAEASLVRARRAAAGDDELVLDVEEALAHTWALQGRVEDASVTGEWVLDRLDDADGERAARLRLVLARAALVAGRPEEAATITGHVRSTTRGELASRALALAAQAAIACGALDDARVLALGVVEAGADGSGGDEPPPDVVCEALEVLGRIERNQDLAAAEAIFDRARVVAERHGLELWRARALHELGTIDLMTRPRFDRLLAAREAAEATGSVSTLALVDLHVTAVALALWEGDGLAVEAAERCVELSRRMRLSTLGMGLVHLAAAHAMGGDERAMEAAIADALEADGDALDVRAGVHGRARAMLALRRADRSWACDEMDAAVTILELDASIAFPFRGVWALLRSILDRDGAGAIARTRDASGWGNLLNQATTWQAEAIELGRVGRGGEATEAALAAHRELNGRVGEPFRMVPWHLVAEAALRDGWGEPVAWLLECLAVFEACHLTELASSCRSLLREAGAKVPRRGRGDAAVPPALRKLGVTSREVDVLQLVAGGLTNREVAARLHLSPKTVENHVSNLLVKTGAGDRIGLARFVERLGGG